MAPSDCQSAMLLESYTLVLVEASGDAWSECVSYSSYMVFMSTLPTGTACWCGNVVQKVSPRRMSSTAAMSSSIVAGRHLAECWQFEIAL